MVTSCEHGNEVSDCKKKNITSSRAQRMQEFTNILNVLLQDKNRKKRGDGGAISMSY